MGEAINLLNNFKVEKVIFNCGPHNNLENELIKVLDKKKIKYYSCIKELTIDDNKLSFLQTKECDIDEIKTGATIQNPASWKIMERFGFVKLDKTKMVEYTYVDEPVEDYQYYITKEMYFENKNNLSMRKK